jgi:hypothetical protein
MTDPRRAERLWLALAVAPVWVVSVGCAADVALPAPIVDLLPAPHRPPPPLPPPRAPMAGVRRAGCVVFIADACCW